MTKLLRKWFIKDFTNVTDKKVREKHGLLASIFGIITNVILVAIKLTIGLIAKSMSIISDSLNNLSDVATSSINLVGFKMSNKPADKEHPFGHQRIEYIAGMIVSFVIIALAIVMGYSAIMKIIEKDNSTSYSLVTFIILAVAIVIKLIQGLFYREMAKTINSVSLKANSQDSFNDVISTSAVLICALIQFILNKHVPESRPYLYLVDGIASLIVALIIVIMGVKLVIETANPLIGAKPDTEQINNIISEIKKHKGVLGIHDLVVHSYGPSNLFVTLHVEVDARVDVMDSHELIDKIEMEIANKYGVEITIHMDPIITDSPEINELHQCLKTIIKEHLNEETHYHDLRIVKGKKRTNVLFDIEVPFDYQLKDQEIIALVSEEIKKQNEAYHCIIKIDHEYI